MTGDRVLCGTLEHPDMLGWSVTNATGSGRRGWPAGHYSREWKLTMCSRYTACPPLSFSHNKTKAHTSLCTICLLPIQQQAGDVFVGLEAQSLSDDPPPVILWADLRAVSLLAPAMEDLLFLQRRVGHVVLAGSRLLAKHVSLGWSCYRFGLHAPCPWLKLLELLLWPCRPVTFSCRLLQSVTSLSCLKLTHATGNYLIGWIIVRMKARDVMDESNLHIWSLGRGVWVSIL